MKQIKDAASVKIKAGDKVRVIAGKNKGKKGKVIQVFKSRNKASVEGINLSIKHMRPRRQNEKGQKIEFPAPINISNLKLICPRCSKVVRVSYKILEKSENRKEKKVRMCAKCKELID